VPHPQRWSKAFGLSGIRAVQYSRTAPSASTRTAVGPRGKADVLYVADAFKVMAIANELLAAQ